MSERVVSWYRTLLYHKSDCVGKRWSVLAVKYTDQPWHYDHLPIIVKVPLLSSKQPWHGMESSRSLKVCCGIWHPEVSIRSYKSCKLWSGASMDLTCSSSTSHKMFDWIEIWGIFRLSLSYHWFDMRWLAEAVEHPSKSRNITANWTYSK